MMTPPTLPTLPITPNVTPFLFNMEKMQHNDFKDKYVKVFIFPSSPRAAVHPFARVFVALFIFNPVGTFC